MLEAGLNPDGTAFMSAFARTADSERTSRHVRKVPESEIGLGYSANDRCRIQWRLQHAGPDAKRSAKIKLGH
jgi:hypothetical protein